MVLITIVTGANLNQLITGGAHIVGFFMDLNGILGIEWYPLVTKHGEHPKISRILQGTGL